MCILARREKEVLMWGTLPIAETSQKWHVVFVLLVIDKNLVIGQLSLREELNCEAVPLQARDGSGAGVALWSCPALLERPCLMATWVSHWMQAVPGRRCDFEQGGFLGPGQPLKGSRAGGCVPAAGRAIFIPGRNLGCSSQHPADAVRVHFCDIQR